MYYDRSKEHGREAGFGDKSEDEDISTSKGCPASHGSTLASLLPRGIGVYSIALMHFLSLVNFESGSNHHWHRNTHYLERI